MKDRRRVSRACTACRSHKIKCTGEKPLCKHCTSTNRECVYIMARKDRLKVITDQCLQMAGLLRALRNSATAEERVRIADILNTVAEETSDISPATASTDLTTENGASPESRETCSPDQDRKLSVEVLDVLDENIHGEQPRATGFVGRSSEIHWLRVALSQAEESEEGGGGILPQRRGSYAFGNDPTRTFSYWTDGQQPDLGLSFDAEELPPPDVAESLLQCYVLKIQDSFPIFPRKTFEDRFLRYFTAVRHGRPLPLNPRWKAILNLVFAIAARFSHLSKASWRADEHDHLVYQARARHLGLSEVTIFNPADLQQVQCLGLLAFYWMSSGQVNRAWTSIGLAVRFAYSLGLHVRNEDPSATAATRETLVRTWWSLHWLESTLSTMTGRPSIIVDSRCSVPMPIPNPEERMSDGVDHAQWVEQSNNSFNTPPQTSSRSSSMALGSRRDSVGLMRHEADSGSYFRAVAQLSSITQSILSTLYSAGTMAQTSEDIQRDISQIGRRLEQWLRALPSGFNLQHPPSAVSEPFARERMLLGFRFCGARILLTRPCLTSQGQSWSEVNENSFTSRSADACVEAAKTMVGFLPDEPQCDLIRHLGPWWSITHHILQATSVLLLALSCPSITSHDNLTSLQCTKKAIRWLHTIQDPMAAVAYQKALDALEIIGRRSGFDCSDLWSLRAGEMLYAGNHMQHSVADIFMSTTPGSANADTVMASYAAFDAVMTGTAFSPYDGPLHFGNSYYVAGA